MAYQPTTTGSLPRDLAALMADLNDLGTAKHNAAVAKGHDTLEGRGYEAQSHAYLNAAVWVQELLDAHAR